jgi:hypothetical protein
MSRMDSNTNVDLVNNVSLILYISIIIWLFLLSVNFIIVMDVKFVTVMVVNFFSSPFFQRATRACQEWYLIDTTSVKLTDN